MPTRAGSTQGLAEIVDKPVSTIAEVADRLGEVYEHARTRSIRGLLRASKRSFHGPGALVRFTAYARRPAK